MAAVTSLAAAVAFGAPAPAADADWEAAKALFAKGKWRDADAALSIYSKRVPPPAHRGEALVLAGRCREKQRDTAGARKLYEKVAGDDALRRTASDAVADAYDRLHALHLAIGTSAPVRARLVDEAASRIGGTAALGRILEREGDARLAQSDLRSALSAYSAAPSMTLAGTNALSLLRDCVAVGSPPLSDKDLAKLASVAAGKPACLAPICERLSKRGDGWKAEDFLARDHLVNGRAKESAAIWDGMLRGRRGPADRIGFSKAEALLSYVPNDGLAALDEWLVRHTDSPLRERVEAFRVQAEGRHGDPAKAVALAEEFLASHPGGKFSKGVETAMAMAKGAIKRKAQLAAEIAARDEAVRGDPELARVVKAEGLLESGRIDAAARSFAAFRNQPRHPLWGRAWFGLGRARLAKGDAKGALEVWDEVWRRSLVSTNVAFAAEARRASGDVWLEDFGDPERALAAYGDALGRKPEVADDGFAMNRGLALLALGRADDARAVFVERRDRDGLDLAEFAKWDNMAKLCLAAWQPPSGGKRPDRRARVDFTLAEGLLAGGMAGRALKLYARARAGLPFDDGGDRCALGEALCLAALGRHRDALKGYAEFKSRFAKSLEAPKALLYGGVLCASPEVGDYREARKWFADVVRLRPGSPEAVAAEFYDATLAWRSRQWKDAERLHRSFAERHPDSPLAKVAMEERLPAIAAKSLEIPMHDPVDITNVVWVKPTDRKRRAFRIEKATAYNAHLDIKPENGWGIVSTEIVSIDSRRAGVLWTGPNPRRRDLHRYHLADAFSSQEFVMIDGKLSKASSGGGGGTQPPFRVTVPSVDVDWSDFRTAADENDEETRYVVVPLNTNKVSDIRYAILNSPFDDDERFFDEHRQRRRPDFPYGEPVEPFTSIWWSAKDDLLLLRHANGSKIQINKEWTFRAFDFDLPWQWPLLFEIQPLQPAESFEIFTEGQVDDVNEKALDRIRGRIVNVDIDVDSDYDGDIDDGDEPMEETQGGFVCVGADHLALVNLAFAPNLSALPGKLTLSATKGGSRIKVWQNADRTGEVALPKEWTGNASIPSTLYVEGLEASQTMRDVELTLEYDDNPNGSDGELFKCNDKITLTVINVDLVGYAAWRGEENKRVPDEEEFDPGFLVTTESPGHLMAKLTFKAVPLVGGDVVRSYRVSRGGFAYFDNALTTDAETPIQGSADKSFAVRMQSPANLNDENFSSVDVEYIVRHRNGAIIGKDKCRLLRPYVVAIGDSLTYGLMRYDHKFQTPTWDNPWTNGYPTEATWEDVTRIHSEYANKGHRLLSAYQGYRGYLSMRLPGFSWLGNDTNGHGPFHKGYPGAKIGEMFAPIRLGTEVFSKAPSYTFVIYLGGMNNCSGGDITDNQNVLNIWNAGVSVIKSARMGKGRTLLLALQVPPLSPEYKRYYSNNHDIRYQTAQNNISFVNQMISSYHETNSGFIGTNVNIATEHTMDDGMHFSSSGYETISGKVLKALEVALW